MILVIKSIVFVDNVSSHRNERKEIISKFLETQREDSSKRGEFSASEKIGFSSLFANKKNDIGNRVTGILAKIRGLSWGSERNLERLEIRPMTIWARGVGRRSNERRWERGVKGKAFHQLTLGWPECFGWFLFFSTFRPVPGASHRHGFPAGSDTPCYGPREAHERQQSERKREREREQVRESKFYTDAKNEKE